MSKEEEAGESVARGILATMSLKQREEFVQGMNNIMCLLCCEPRSERYICHCNNDD